VPHKSETVSEYISTVSMDEANVHEVYETAAARQEDLRSLVAKVVQMMNENTSSMANGEDQPA
jgi:hypothetical protein